MKIYVIACDNTRYKTWKERAPENIRAAQRVIRTPDNCEEIPAIYTKNIYNKRVWALTCAFKEALLDAQTNNEDALVFEDDAVYCQDFTEKYNKLIKQLPDDWDMFYLGGQLKDTQLHGIRPVPNTDLAYGACIHRLHAWQIRHKAIPRLLEVIENSKHINKTLDTLILPLHRQEDFKVYFPTTDWLVGQAYGRSFLNNLIQSERWWSVTLKEVTQTQYGCDFVVAGDSYVCKHCHRRIPKTPGSLPPMANCKAPPELTKRVITYLTAVAEHVFHGLQTRQDEEVELILQVCKNCDQYDNEKEICNKCGCRCTNGKSAFTNKIRMKTESCPIGNW